MTDALLPELFVSYRLISLHRLRLSHHFHLHLHPSPLPGLFWVERKECQGGTRHRFNQPDQLSLRSSLRPPSPRHIRPYELSHHCEKVVVHKERRSRPAYPAILIPIRYHLDPTKLPFPRSSYPLPKATFHTNTTCPQGKPNLLAPQIAESRVNCSSSNGSVK